LEKRSAGRLIPEGGLQCMVEWEKGIEEGWIHNISTQGALLEAKSDFGISNIKITVRFGPSEDSLILNAVIRWHAVSPQDQTDHYGLVFRPIDDFTRDRLDEAIQKLVPSAEE